jgi:AcrR family transcriptional regulator
MHYDILTAWSSVKRASGGAMAGTRDAQRRRTRRALIEAAQELLRAGRTPTVDDVAATADVSRRTVYMHFATLDQLLLDASVGLLSAPAVDSALDAGASSSARDRVEALVRVLFASAADTLPVGRQIIRLTVDGSTAGGTPRRGYRRIEWIERALEPARERLTPPEFERLVSALAVLIGWEAMTVLADVRAVPPPEQLDTVVWACRALVDAALRSDLPG